MKVLLISHNPFSTYQSMGKTFVSLFSEFEKAQLCQLYIYPSYPDVDAVDSCYRITDREAIKSIIPCFCVGQEVAVRQYNGDMIEDKADAKIYAKSSNHQPLKRLIRDAVWKMSHWYNRKLREWLEKEAPTCIFLAPGYAKFIYDIALKISKERNIPVITYICDDYYFLEKPKSMLGRLELRSLQKKTRQIFEHTSRLVTISEEIKNQYTNEFGVKGEVIMTGSAFEPCDNVLQKDEIKTFSYFGNIGLNRERPLSHIGRILDEINTEQGTDYHLDIYTRAEDEAVKSAFGDIKSIRLCGFLTGEEFEKHFFGADCLVHVEDFSKESIDLIKGSVSTKIADSLSASIPLLAYGPSGVASIEHLKRNECAFVCTQHNELKAVVTTLIQDKNERQRITENATDTARKYHRSGTNSIKLKEIVKQIQEKE